jgi:hypothetical protein
MSSNNPLNTCFSDLSTITSTYYGQYIQYATSWETFRRVELYNINVSTQRAGGNSNITYYQFFSNQEKTYYNEGAGLFFSKLGFSTTVQKN